MSEISQGVPHVEYPTTGKEALLTSICMLRKWRDCMTPVIETLEDNLNTPRAAQNLRVLYAETATTLRDLNAVVMAYLLRDAGQGSPVYDNAEGLWQTHGALQTVLRHRGSYTDAVYRTAEWYGYDVDARVAAAIEGE